MAGKRPIVLVDGDPLVYSCGFASQKTLIGIVAEKDGAVESFAFAGAGELSKWKKESPGWEIKARHDTLEVEPVEWCLRSVKNQLKILAQLGSSLAIYLTGTGNYRDKIKNFIDYKGNRDRLKRPVHYQAIRDYLVTYHGAIVVDGREADDELSIMAHRRRGKCIVASCDKDLDQVEGKHYDYWQQVEYTVTAEDARRAFWIQVLAGDPTDNVHGCWRVGAKKAADVIDSCLEYDDHDVWDRVLAEYRRSCDLRECPYSIDDCEAIALETARMVYIQRRPGELWNPPGIPFGTIGLNADD